MDQYMVATIDVSVISNYYVLELLLRIRAKRSIDLNCCFTFLTICILYQFYVHQFFFSFGLCFIFCRSSVALLCCHLELQGFQRTKNIHMVTFDLYLHATRSSCLFCFNLALINLFTWS